MHELAITQNMFNLVIAQAGQAKAKKVTRINMVIGEMTGVVGDSVQFYFDTISKGSLAEGATLTFRMVPMQARCRDCGQTFVLEESDWRCPGCRGSQLELAGGSELFVESIEVE